MKKLFTISLFLSLGVLVTSAQSSKDAEAVNWITPPVYTCKKLSIKTDKIEMECESCKYLEIQTASGVTGIYITGTGNYTVKEKSISDKFYGCMIRFNPRDYARLVKTENSKPYEDEAYLHTSVLQLKALFKHCYHAGWDALIPGKGDYVLNFTGNTFKDILVSFAEEQDVVYNFIERKQY